MPFSTDILIIGGGAIGLATAVELASQGASVTVLSRNLAEAALQAAAGMLAPQAEGLDPGPMLELCLQSRALYPDWTAKLERLTGLDCEYWPSGILAPADAEDLATGRLDPTQPCRDGSQWLEAAQIQALQPGLSSQVVGGWWYPADAQVNNRALARALQTAAQDLGVKIASGISVQAIQSSKGAVKAVQTTAGEWQAGTYILATGAWAADLLPIPVIPRKGQMLSLLSPLSPAPLRQVIFGNQIYLVPRRNGQLVVGATNEAVGFTPANTPAGVRSLLDKAINLYPPLRDWALQECWWGFRPATPDELPILGSSPYKNLVLATGHYRNGILLAPITAQLIADLVLHQRPHPLLEAFHWQRFSSYI